MGVSIVRYLHAENVTDEIGDLQALVNTREKNATSSTLPEIRKELPSGLQLCNDSRGSNEPLGEFKILTRRDILPIETYRQESKAFIATRTTKDACEVRGPWIGEAKY